ncbi:Protein POLLEN DEFECTIVE IN GUIDANCE 1 isoform B [Glycine soja]|uniref:Protein POLLEN DEFECTIVE IN GUIDANCE 1 isoform B n=1 Tax=Glycine soja TaxID=3848 RepID=A0A445I6K8_GLYSO|nr:Protein POLLEN DEFECTIVE IN GUIDANCE 1 isoform B [Glycine soja]
MCTTHDRFGKVKMRHRGAPEEPPQPQPSFPHRKKKRKRRATATATVGSTSVSFETSHTDAPDQLNTHIHDAAVACEQSKATAAGDGFRFGELRQRSVNGRDSFVDLAVTAVGDGYVTETVESLELKRVLGNDSIPKRSPVSSFLEKVLHGNSVCSTTTVGDEKGRERVYDTIFRLPWRCELLIDVGFFVCFNSFLSLLTIMPPRIVMTIWRLLKTRKFKRPSTIELSDFGCFLIMICGVVVLQQIDISLIYHMIRGQETIKLYVIYNMLEIFDKLCQNFIGDVLPMLFHSAEEFARCPPETESMKFWIWRFISDQVLAVVASNILFLGAITLSACIVSHYNALPALLVSNNFSEIKSYVFKGYSKDNVHSMVYSDSIERFHISAFVLFVLAQNILEAEGPWFGSFISNILLVYLFEMAIDVIKHSFIAKFNNISPVAYSEFLEVLCKQTLHMQTEDAKKKLTFVPLAPACVVIRVLAPVYAASLPYNPLPWRLFWILLFSAITYIMLTSLKVLIGMVLRKHARCTKEAHTLQIMLMRQFFEAWARKTVVMILRNLEAFEPIIKAGWRFSKFYCFIRVTKTYLIAPAVTYGPSMIPTIDLKSGMFLMEKISPRFGKVARGDIVVLRNPQHPRHFMTKRVVGLEGDSLTRISSPDNSDKSKTIVVPKGAVWVEGDNKYNSNDSRKFGPVPYDLIDGKMLWRVSLCMI